VARQGIGALAIFCTVAVVVRAQEVPPGVIARFDVTQRLEYSDNPDFDVDGDSDFFGRTVLGFGLESVTQVQRFALNLGTDIEEGRDDGSSFDVTNSSARLSYDRNTRNALIGVSANYRESDVSSSISDDDFDLDGNVINQDSGKRKTYRYGLNGAVGREAPIGASFNWNYSEIKYSDTSDADFTDRSTNSFGGRINFRIDPRITARLTGKYIDFDAQGNGTDRETTGLGIGSAFAITPILSANIGLSYDKIERTGDETDTDDGVSLNLAVTRDMPNGSLVGRFSSDVASNDNGRRSYLSVSRAMDLPRGDLSVELGVTGADTIGTDPLVNINYRHQLPAAALSFGLSQRVSIDNDNRERINTRLRAGYDQRINSLSSFGVDIAFFDRYNLDAGGNDSQRIDLSLSYRHDLTRDWGLVSGISHDLATEDNRDDRQRTTVFVGLQRSFRWNP